MGPCFCSAAATDHRAPAAALGTGGVEEDQVAVVGRAFTDHAGGRSEGSDRVRCDRCKHLGWVGGTSPCVPPGRYGGTDGRLTQRLMVSMSAGSSIWTEAARRAVDVIAARSCFAPPKSASSLGCRTGPKRSDNQTSRSAGFRSVSHASPLYPKSPVQPKARLSLPG